MDRSKCAWLYGWTMPWNKLLCFQHCTRCGRTFFLSFFLGWRIPNLVTGLSGGCAPDPSSRTQETVPDHCRLIMADPLGKNSSRCLWAGMHPRPTFFFSPKYLSLCSYALSNQSLYFWKVFTSTSMLFCFPSWLPKKDRNNKHSTLEERWGDNVVLEMCWYHALHKTKGPGSLGFQNM